MGNGMNKVLPGLYVGNYQDSKDQQQLEKHKITHIIAIHDSPRRLLPDKHYLCVMASDTPDQNLSQYFSVCNDFIHSARIRDGNVLIHCLAGMSRSVTVAVAYIMTVTSLGWKEALKVVRAGRSVANPNVGFQSQLQSFETYRLAEERRRLRERFPLSVLEESDRNKCYAALDNYQRLLESNDICEGNCARGKRCPTGVCNVDPAKGLFRRRPSSTSTRSRLHPSTSMAASVGDGGSSSGSSTSGSGLSVGSIATRSCPTSPKHSSGSRRSLTEPNIPEDEEASLGPTTSTAASPSIAMAATATAGVAAAAAATAAASNVNLLRTPSLPTPASATKFRRSSNSGSIGRSAAATATATATASAFAPVASSYSGAVVKMKKHDAPRTAVNETQRCSMRSSAASSGDSCNANRRLTADVVPLQRSVSTVSGFAVRPRSSPAGLHSYTSSVPSSVHGSRADLSGGDKGSAIYLGCSAPRNSTWSLSSRGSSGGSAPQTPAHTPPASPRHGIRRAASLVKKTR